nr:unnamed protein product [Callosobruchus chinensis]
MYKFISDNLEKHLTNVENSFRDISRRLIWLPYLSKALNMREQKYCRILDIYIEEKVAEGGALRQCHRLAELLFCELRGERIGFDNTVQYDIPGEAAAAAYQGKKHVQPR